MKHMYLRLRCSFTLTGFFKKKKKNLLLTSTKMCAIGQTNEYSNKLKKYEQTKRLIVNIADEAAVSSISSSSHYRTVQCKTIRNS